MDKNVENINEKENIIIKKNELNEGIFVDFTKNEYKLFLYLMSILEFEKLTAKTTAKNFCEYFEINGNMRAKLKEFSKTLFKKSISFRDLEDKNYWKEINMFSSIEYKNGNLKISFNRELFSYLKHLTFGFTKYYLKYIKNLNSIHSIRIYELLKQYESLNVRTFKFEELETILNVKSKYRLYSGFKINVLEKAKKEINLYSDIKIEYEEIRSSKKVELIKFIIVKNSKEKDAIEDIITTAVLEFKRVSNAKISMDTMKKLIDVYGVDEVLKYIKNFGCFTVGKTNAIGFLIAALKNKYEIAPSSMQISRVPQETNYEQREYTKEYLDGFYEDFWSKHIKE